MIKKKNSSIRSVGNDKVERVYVGVEAFILRICHDNNLFREKQMKSDLF